MRLLNSFVTLFFKTKAFRCYFGSEYLDGSDIKYHIAPGDTDPSYMEWNVDVLGQYLGGNVSDDILKPTSGANPITWQRVSAKFQSLGSITFTLVPLPFLSEVCMMIFLGQIPNHLLLQVGIVTQPPIVLLGSG